MKKILIMLAIITSIYCFNNIVQAGETNDQQVIMIEIPANQIEAIDVKYKEPSPSATTVVKESANKTVTKTKELTNKTVQATKKATKKTKDATKKTFKSTKEFTSKTVDNTKDIIDNINPARPVTLENIENSAAIKHMKIERNTKKAAYNSKIKDISAQIKAAQYSTTLTEVERQDKIHTLDKEKTSLIEQRDTTIKEYDEKINELRRNK